MRSAPRKHTTEEALYAAALRALMRRSYSVFEMRKYLETRAESPALAKDALAKLREKRYLDDARYALEFARRHAQVRRQGRFRVERELRARGVADSHIAAAIDQGFAETDESAVVRKLIDRRLRAVRGPATAGKPVERKHLASLYRMLLRSGFDAALIHRELNRVTKDAAESLPQPEFGDIEA